MDDVVTLVCKVKRISSIPYMTYWKYLKSSARRGIPNHLKNIIQYVANARLPVSTPIHHSGQMWVTSWSLYQPKRIRSTTWVVAWMKTCHICETQQNTLRSTICVISAYIILNIPVWTLALADLDTGGAFSNCRGFAGFFSQIRWE